MDNIKIGNFLHGLRKEKGLTQQELADLYNISSKTVSKWECGDSIPNTQTLIKLSKLYNITIDEILNGEFNSSLTNKNDNKLIEKEQEVNINLKHLNNYKMFFLISIVTMLIGFILQITLLSIDYGTLGFGIGLSLILISLLIILIADNKFKYETINITNKDDLKNIKLLRFKKLYIFTTLFILILLFSFMMLLGGR